MQRAIPQEHGMSVEFEAFLVFDGECRQAVDYYRKVFQIDPATIKMTTFGELDENLLKEVNREKFRDGIMFAEFVLYGQKIKCSDCADFFHEIFEKGTNFMMSIALSDKDEVARIFSKLAEEGKVIFGLGETGVTDLLGIVTDKFGITWMLSIVPKGREIISC